MDPFNGGGLIDFLPQQVSKAYALEWWCGFAKHERRAVVFAGDSGNDTAALTAGFRAIVVANADRNVALEVYQVHKKQGWENRLVVADAPATSGLLEGCLRFRLFPEAVMTSHEELPFQLGANPLDLHRTHFRVWAPQQESVEVEVRNELGTRSYELARETDGYFAGIAEDASPGDLYRYRLDGQMLAARSGFAVSTRRRSRRIANHRSQQLSLDRSKLGRRAQAGSRDLRTPRRHVHA